MFGLVWRENPPVDENLPGIKIDNTGAYVHRCHELGGKERFCYGSRQGCAQFSQREIADLRESEHPEDAAVTNGLKRGALEPTPLPRGHKEDTPEKRYKRICRDAFSYDSIVEFCQQAQFLSTEDASVRVFTFARRSQGPPDGVSRDAETEE